MTGDAGTQIAAAGDQRRGTQLGGSSGASARGSAGGSISGQPASR
jgi:hypothetical protein